VAGRKSKAALLAEHEHLKGLAVGRTKEDFTGKEYGKVSAVWVEGVYPIVEVDFPDADPIQLVVVRSRRPRNHVRDYIWLKPGEQDDEYHWVDLDSALGPTKRIPSVSVVVLIRARTWNRVATKKKLALAQGLAEEIASLLEDILDEFPPEAPVDIHVDPKVIRQEESDDFNLVIAISAFDLDEVSGVELFEKVQDYFEAAQIPPGASEHWPTVVVNRLREQRGLAPDHIFVSNFVLEGRIGEMRLEPVHGRLELR
jgi:hypothetical protein